MQEMRKTLVSDMSQKTRPLSSSPSGTQAVVSNTNGTEAKPLSLAGISATQKSTQSQTTQERPQLFKNILREQLALYGENGEPKIMRQYQNQPPLEVPSATFAREEITPPPTVEKPMQEPLPPPPAPTPQNPSVQAPPPGPVKEPESVPESLPPFKIPDRPLGFFIPTNSYLASEVTSKEESVDTLAEKLGKSTFVAPQKVKITMWRPDMSSSQ